MATAKTVNTAANATKPSTLKPLTTSYGAGHVRPTLASQAREQATKATLKLTIQKPHESIHKEAIDGSNGKLNRPPKSIHPNGKVPEAVPTQPVSSGQEKEK